MERNKRDFDGVQISLDWRRSSRLSPSGGRNSVIVDSPFWGCNKVFIGYMIKILLFAHSLLYIITLLFPYQKAYIYININMAHNSSTQSAEMVSVPTCNVMTYNPL